jgi:putative NADH-flavin reductase
MRIAIIGASRGIGAELSKAAIKEGHEVTALVRAPAKLNASIAGLKIIKGDDRRTGSNMRLHRYSTDQKTRR